MKKIFPIFGLVLALVLGACQATQSPSSTTSPSPVAQTSATEVASPTTAPAAAATDAVASPASLAIGQKTPAGPAAPPGCTVVSRDPTPEPTQASIFPPVTEKDWVQGPLTATATILEYSDFQ